MKIKYGFFLSIATVLLYSSNTYSQLVTSTAQTPTQLVQNVLIGAGVNASNVLFTGVPNAIGYFDGSNTNVGLNSGIILTSGTVLNTGDGPFGPNNSGSSGVDNGAPGEPLLAAAAGNGSFNAARLEFDFVPQSDSISFNFVFGSEEYLEFVNGGVNDAFGFFISGPNPAGGNFVDQNIAIIPGTTLPVTIDNLNSTSNSAYYINNGDGNTAPQNGSNTYVQYDGLTVPLAAKSAVICGQTYHIIIAISDIGDGVWDSGVFIEEGSFTSPSVDISSDLSSLGNVLNDSTLIEGCDATEIWFVRTDSIAFNQSLPVTITGTATEGVDFNTLPNSIDFLPGEDSVSIVFNANLDGILEGLEYLQILVRLPNACGTSTSDSLRLYIQDTELMQTTPNDTIVVCPGDDIPISADVTGGNPGYTYLWDSGETAEIINVNPLVTTSYNLIVTDICGQTVNEIVTVDITNYSPLIINVLNDTIVPCIDAVVDLTAVSSGGAAGHVLTWFDGSQNNTLNVTTSQTTTYSVSVVDQCGNTAINSATVTIVEPEVFTQLTEDPIICRWDTTSLTVTPSGGYGNTYTYLWSTGETDSTIIVTPGNSTMYTVEISDACGYIKKWDTIYVSMNPLDANFGVNGNLEEEGEVYFTNYSIGANAYYWDLGNGISSTYTDPSTVYYNTQNYTIMLVAYNNDGCVDTTELVIEIKPIYSIFIPNTFTPDGDEFNQTWRPFIRGIDIYDFELFVFNRWGEVVWESHDPSVGWDGTYKGRLIQTGGYSWKTSFKMLSNDERKMYHGTVNVIR
tara:strand:- start:4176 stop:6554 length:2379 start_codon:yes stop_codon:yes gene_type:complete